jgi:hypothetical protein
VDIAWADGWEGLRTGMETVKMEMNAARSSETLVSTK